MCDSTERTSKIDKVTSESGNMQTNKTNTYKTVVKKVLDFIELDVTQFAKTTTSSGKKLKITHGVESKCNTFFFLAFCCLTFCPISRLCFLGSLLVLTFACSLLSSVYVSFFLVCLASFSFGFHIIYRCT